MRLGVPSGKAAMPCGFTRGRFSFRSTPSGASKGRRPPASGRHGPIPFVETQRRCVSTKGGSGRHHVLTRPPFRPGARQRKSILSSTSSRANRHPKYEYVTVLTRLRVSFSTPQLLNYSSRVPPQQCVVWQLLCQGGYPGGGSGGHRRPKAEEAEARGKHPPLDLLLLNLHERII